MSLPEANSFKTVKSQKSVYSVSFLLYVFSYMSVFIQMRVQYQIHPITEYPLGFETHTLKYSATQLDFNSIFFSLFLL